CFSQDEAFVRADGIGSAREHVARECGEVGRRVFGFERELEAALAVEVAVTRTRVAPGAREYGEDVTLERNFPRPGRDQRREYEQRGEDLQSHRGSSAASHSHKCTTRRAFKVVVGLLL